MYVFVNESLCVCVCVCMCVFVSVCLSVYVKCVCVCDLASDSSETIEVIIMKHGMVTASDMLMHHVLIILTLTFIQGHTDLNYENNKCLIISETIQAMPIMFAAKMFRLKVYMTIASLITLTFIQDHKFVSNLTTF